MDFDDTPAEAAFRQECRAWLQRHGGPPKAHGTELMRAYRPRTEAEDEQIVARARAWQGLKFAHGWAGMHWPVEYGGKAMAAPMAAIFAEEEAEFDVPGRFFQVGVDMVGPTIIEFGSDAQRARYLPPLLSGEEIWCQLFSEPGAGSDLASLSTSGRVDGDRMIVTGQKVWTTGAHYSDWGILLVRTDSAAPKHAGISFVLVDMSSSGIEVRPLRQIDGGLHFNEVFFTEVEVPMANLVGGLHDGWRVARATLTHERTAIGGGGMVEFDQLRALLSHGPADRNTASQLAEQRQRLADLYTQFEILRFLSYRVRTDVSAGRRPGPESSVMKLAASRLYERAGNFIMETQGAAGMLWREDAPFRSAFSDVFLTQWAPRIGGGTDQIQRNIIGERVLGLPRDP
jgi:alkylation response protein AidB-like acyl-CoA dehydrogenase